MVRSALSIPFCQSCRRPESGGGSAASSNSRNTILVSNSVRFLARTGQLADAGFVLDHIDDLDSVFVMDQGGLRAVAAGAGGPALGLIA